MKEMFKRMLPLVLIVVLMLTMMPMSFAAEAKSITVTYNSNYPSGTQASKTQTGTNTNLQALSYGAAGFDRPSGYSFQGWSKSSNGSVAYAAGDSLATLTENTTLYAIWKKSIIISGGDGWTPSTSSTWYDLTYRTDGGGYIDGDSSQEVKRYEDGDAVQAIPYDGYRFAGWSDGVSSAWRRDTDVRSDITVKAYFTYVGGSSSGNWDDTPATGDTAPIAPIALIGAAALAGALVLLRKARKA